MTANESGVKTVLSLRSKVANLPTIANWQALPFITDLCYRLLN